MGYPAVKLSNIQKSYSGRQVLKGITLSIEAGQFCGLIGKNGVGKSTLMRLLVRQELPSSGEGWVLGENLKVDSSGFNERVGYVSEAINYALPFPLTTFFKHYSRIFKRWNQNLFDGTLKQLGINQERYFATLSRGQRMQVAFSAAIAVQPEILILDEVTSVLDANARALFMEYLGEFTRKGGTVLLATNLISEIHQYADRLILLHEGNVRLNLSKKEVSSLYSKLRTKRVDHPVLGDPECVEVALNSDGSSSYVLPTAKLKQFDGTEILLDNRGITAEEMFLYFTRGRNT